MEEVYTGGGDMEVVNEVYSIKEISDIIGFKPHVIRYYEKEFELEIPRDEGNRRYFTYKELEELRNIKILQDKGLTNKQIKNLMKSPEVMMNGNDNALQEIAVSSSDYIQYAIENSSALIQEEFQNLLNQTLASIQQLDYRKEIEVLSEKVDELKNELVNQEKDILICENAKLKMQVKEKAYELAELKEKIKREENKNKSIFKKIFGGKQ
ncbi:transcriptional regulator MerR family [Clostridium aceticum]|uniref:Transcriptional regulator MerR family n=2 Tax=Clostridium aceticum TaxID=84022 RepID=A0A0G3WBU1_9CLOT|nr:transcriptional regulator MerR family [Clostridium aceticum]